jgi:hypothetical protein
MQKFDSCPLRSKTLVFPGFFRIFGEVPLAVCSAHAGSVHDAVQRLLFASRYPNRVVFRVTKTLGFLRIAFGPEPRRWGR